MGSETLVIGGSLGTAAVSAVIYAFRVLLKRAIDQMDASIKENTTETRALRDELRSLKDDVQRNNLQTTVLSVEMGVMKQRIDAHDGKFDGLRSGWREDFLEVKHQNTKLHERLAVLEANHVK